jgi:chromosome segregation ATPase
LAGGRRLPIPLLSQNRTNSTAVRRRVKEISVDHSNHTLLQAGSQTAISDRMRELLARAAQDHVYEQRTQGAVLDEIRQRLEGMEWLLREVRERELGGLSGTMETVSGRLDEIASKPPEWAEGLAQHVELVRDHVDAVGGRVQTIIEGTRGFADTMAEVAKHLDQLQGSMDAAATRFTRLDKAITELAQRTERLECGVLDLTASVGDSVGAATNRLAAAAEQVNAKIDGMSAMVEGKLAEVIGRIDRVDGRIEAADECLADIDTRMTGVETTVGAADGKLSAIDTRMTGLETKVGAADGKLSTIDGRLSHHDDRFDVLEGRIDARFTTVDEHVGAAEGRLTGRMDTAARRFEEVNDRLDTVDDRVEAVNQRVGQLPALLEISELHKHVGEIGTVHGKRFDSIDGRLTEAASALAPLLEVARARPDREQITETINGALTRAMEPAHGDLTRRLGALEENMLALAEALLRPARGKD